MEATWEIAVKETRTEIKKLDIKIRKRSKVCWCWWEQHVSGDAWESRVPESEPRRNPCKIEIVQERETTIVSWWY